MKIQTKALFIALLFSNSALAEEDDLDLDYYFSIKQKSTISDFPLQEIGAEELSDAAIAGALHANSTGNDLDAKPIYEEQEEASNKEKLSKTGKEKDLLVEEKLLQFSQHAPAPQVHIPEYITPSIRTLQINSTTVERP